MGQLWKCAAGESLGSISPYAISGWLLPVEGWRAAAGRCGWWAKNGLRQTRALGLQSGVRGLGVGGGALEMGPLVVVLRRELHGTESARSEEL